jgi:transmembrane sensor
MIRQKFDQIIENYFKRQSTDEENKMLDEWSDSHFKRHSENSVFSDDREMEETRSRLWDQIRDKAGLVPESVPLWENKRAWIGAAAAVILMMSLLYIYILPAAHENIASVPATGAQTKNITPTPQRITLPDGSVVVLEKAASLIVDEDYGKHKRSVYLEGAAFFQVERNAAKPFLVHTGDLITEVLGTSFSIRFEPGTRKTIQIEVKTGKVSVYSGSDEVDKRKNGVIATANQKVTYDTELKTIRHELIDEPQIVVPGDVKPDFNYQGAPLSDILNMMKRTYKVDIIVGNSVLNDCRFTGDLNGLDMYRQLDLICEVIGARYEIRGTVVFVNGESCHGN